MKKYILLAAAVLAAVSLSAKTPKGVKYVFTEASELNIIGKLFDNTPNPYHRVDTVKFKGFTEGENFQLRCSSGMAVLFKTNSSIISVKTQYGRQYSPLNATDISYRGYDLYIKKDGNWLWAGNAVAPLKTPEKNCVLVTNMEEGEKECMMYLPTYSELYSVKIGIEEGAWIKPMESPFRYRVGIFGSSYTQGVSTSRGGMTYPMQLMRKTGIQLLSLGCSGNAKMQPYFADVLCAARVDALVFDVFSNPDAEMIKERLFPFIEKVQSAHPNIPLIFQQTIYRENRNFDTEIERKESAKQAMADSLMKIAVMKYDNVYYIKPHAVDKSREESVDGIHPGDYGYGLWAASIEKQFIRILRKYGIN